MRNKTVFLVAILAVIFSSCRDKGSYEYTGVLLDSCVLSPIAFAKVSVFAGQSGDRTTTTDANGYFKISGSWNESGGVMHKQVVPNLVARNDTGRDFFNFEYLPEGTHNLGGLVALSAFDIPVRLDNTDYDCADCTYDVAFLQTGVVKMRGRGIGLQKGAVTGTIRGANTFMVNASTKEFSAPIFLEFTRRDSVKVTYTDIDVTQFIKLCGMGDTLYIKL